MDGFTPLLTGYAGILLLVFILPFVIVVSIGLVTVGLMRSRFGAVIFGVVFPVAAIGLGSWMLNSGLAHPAAPATMAAGLDAIASFWPYSVGLAAIAFLVGVLPKLITVRK